MLVHVACKRQSNKVDKGGSKSPILHNKHTHAYDKTSTNTDFPAAPELRREELFGV